MPVHMEVARILIRETNDTHVVELREKDGDRVFPIMIGLNEAVAINRRILGEDPPRPQTHELLASVIDKLDATLEQVLINALRDGTFFARIVLRREGEILDIDSRPSDALALGVATEVPIFVEEHVLNEVCGN